MKLHKKGLINIIVGLALVLIFTLAMMWVVYKIAVVIGLIVPEAVCEWTVLLGAITKYGTVGLANIPPECKTSHVSVVTASSQGPFGDAEEVINLDDKIPAADRAITNMVGQYKKNPQAWKEIYDIFGNNSQALQYEWALNEVIAGQLQQCWRKVWKGKLPLFNSWWNLVDWKLFGLNKPDYTKEQEVHHAYYAAKSEVLGRLLGKDASIVTTYGAPTFCVYCSRLKFDPPLHVKLGGKTTITSLAAWMRANPARPGEKHSVFEDILDDTQKGIGELSLDYTYAITEPHAVEFVRINEWGYEARALGGEVANFVSSFFGGSSETVQNRNRLVVIPAKDSIYPYGRDVFVSKLAEEKGKPRQCLQQIG